MKTKFEKLLNGEDHEIYDLTGFEMAVFAGAVFVIGMFLYVIFAVVWGVTP